MVFSLKHGIYAHPFEMVACVSTFLSVYGAFQILLYHPEILNNATAGILVLPRFLLWTWVIMGFLGAVTTASGLTLSIFSEKGRIIEEGGLWMMGAMWLSAGAARLMLDLDAWVEYVRYFTIAGGCIVRLMMLNDVHSMMTRWREVESK
jgi:hypothetical protein